MNTIPAIYAPEIIANHFLLLSRDLGGTLTPMQLIKLVYLAHAWMLGLYNKPLLKEEIEAWRYGPVIPTLYQKIKKHRSKPVETIECDPIKIDNEALNIINQVYGLYREFTGIELSMLTHEKGSPWDVTHRHGKKVISDDLIAYYYKKMNSSNR